MAGPLGRGLYRIVKSSISPLSPLRTEVERALSLAHGEGEVVYVYSMGKRGGEVGRECILG